MEGRMEVRFTLVTKVRYRVRDRASGTIAGVGQTVSISRSEMLLRVQHSLRIGDHVAVTVDLLEPSETGRAELTLLGQVIRVESGCVALQFDEQDLKRMPEQK
jgi:hypothetical protein